MIRFGIFILLVCVGTELSAFSPHQPTFDVGAGSGEPNQNKDSDAFKKSLEDCQKLMNDSQANLETLTQARKDLLEELQKLEKEEAAKFMAELEAMEEEWLKKLEEEKESLLKSKDPLEEQWKQWEKLSEATETVQKEKIEKLNREIEEKLLVPSIKRALGKIDSLLDKGDSESLKEAQTLKEKLDKVYSKGLSSKAKEELKAGVDKRSLGISRAQTGYNILGSGGAQAGKYINDTLHSIWGHGSDSKNSQPPSSEESSSLRAENAEQYRQQLNEWRAQQNAGDKKVFNDKMKPLLEKLNNSSDPRLSDISSEIWHDKLPDGSKMGASEPSKSSTPSATPSHSPDSGQSGSASPSVGGVPSVATPSATPPQTPAESSAQNKLANNALGNAVYGGSPGRGTTSTQPHGAGIQKKPSGETEDSKKSAPGRSNSDSDVGQILGRTPSGISAMQNNGNPAAGTPRNSLNSAPGATAQTGINSGQDLGQSTQTKPTKTDKRSFDQKTGVYTSSNAEGLRGPRLDEGTKNPLPPLTNEKIVYKPEAPNESGTSPSGNGSSSNDNLSSNIKAPKSGGTVSLEGPRPPEDIRFAQLDTGNLNVGNSGAANTAGAPNAALTSEGKTDSKMDNPLVGKTIALYGGEDALSISRPITKATPKPTGLASFALNTTGTGITGPSLTDEGTTARGLFAAKTKPAPKKTGVAAQAPQRSIAGGTPKDKDKVLLRVRGFRELRGLLGAR